MRDTPARLSFFFSLGGQVHVFAPKRKQAENACDWNPHKGNRAMQVECGAATATTATDSHFDGHGMIAAMKLAAEIGSLGSLALMIKCRGPRVKELKDPSLDAELATLEKQLAEAKVLETVHGKGCLWKLDHPAVQRKIRLGWISETEIQTARDYRSEGGKPGIGQMY